MNRVSAAFLGLCLLACPVNAQPRKDFKGVLNFCHPGGYTAGVDQVVPKQPWKYNWGRAQFGCNRLVCQQCKQPVQWTLSKKLRAYKCSCASYSYPQLDCLAEERCEGPLYMEVERPDWVCAGHSLRPSTLPPPPLATTFVELDEAYNCARGTALAEQVALDFAKVASQHSETCARFYLHNPKAPGREVLLGLEPAPVDLWCRSLAANVDDLRFRDRLRALALTRDFSRHAVAVMSFDKEWLRSKAEELLVLSDQNGPLLCEALCRENYQWDQQALATLPLVLIRHYAGRLAQAREAEVYWERDYDWLLENYATLQQRDSSFGLYLQQYLERKGWQPNQQTIGVWRIQALQSNDVWSVIPNLVRWDQSWVEDNLAQILDSTPIRGAWVVGLLHKAGSPKVSELLEIVKARTPNDCSL